MYGGARSRLAIKLSALQINRVRKLTSEVTAVRFPVSVQRTHVCEAKGGENGDVGDSDIE